MRLSTRTPFRWRSLIVACAAAACAFPDLSSEAHGQSGPPGPASAEAPVNGIQTVRRGDTVTKVDRTGKGAVLCVRGILQAMRAVGQACHDGADPDFQQELRTALARIDRFIAENARDGTVPSSAGSRHRSTGPARSAAATRRPCTALCGPAAPRACARGSTTCSRSRASRS